MKQYDTIDRLIIEAIALGKTPLYERSVTTESFRLERETGREAFRVIDGRLQALRKSGKIAHKRWGTEMTRRWGIVDVAGEAKGEAS